MRCYVTDYKFKHIYNMNTLKDYCTYAERDVQNALDVIEKIRKYQKDLYDHVQDVLQVSYKKVVVLSRREDYSTHKKYFEVYLDTRPDIEHEHVNGNNVIGEHSEHKKFIGVERNQAIKYADQLAKQHRCKIEKSGWWK